ncbi:unnamed protein product [Clavelina lepadiformis]|uniref:DDE-1 domain-containing protein n=1 Tax=Clavelina lepadiformis TaxID=159417 RepID=A0ABP0G2S6_CLALP
MLFEDLSCIRGKKKAKDRVSLVVCANATGTHNVPCTLIGKPKSPACIKNRGWPVKYLSQRKAWMDVDTCPQKEQAKRLPRGAAGVAYGNPAHLLDAAHYVKQAWDLISDASVRNSFNKAQLITPLDGGVDEEANFMSDMSEILRCFKSMHISIDKDELERFMLDVDDENNEEYSQAILGDVNEVLETMQTENDDTDDEAGPSNDCAPVEIRKQHRFSLL